MNEDIRKPRLISSEAAPPNNVFGVQVKILLRGEHTGGAYCTYEVIVQPGDGPPPHVHHRDDEAFYVLEGEFEVRHGDQTSRVGAGTYVYLPRLTPHTFKNVGTGRGRLLGTAAPAGHEAFFEDIDRISKHGPPSKEEAIAVCRKFGIEILAAERA